MTIHHSTPARAFRLRTLSCLIGIAAFSALAGQASAADVPCFLNGFASGDFSWQMTSPTTGAEYTVEPGGRAWVSISGNARLLTSFDGLASKDCLAYWYKPEVTLQINGNQSLTLADGLFNTQFSQGLSLAAGTYSLGFKGKFQLAAINSQPVYITSPTMAQIVIKEKKAPPKIFGRLLWVQRGWQDQVVASGWACLQEQAQPVNVVFYAGSPYPNGTFLTSAPAGNQAPLIWAPSVYENMDKCGGDTRMHAFDTNLTAWQSQIYGQPIYAHGVYPDGRVSEPLNGSPQSFQSSPPIRPCSSDAAFGDGLSALCAPPNRRFEGVVENPLEN